MKGATMNMAQLRLLAKENGFEMPYHQSGYYFVPVKRYKGNESREAEEFKTAAEAAAYIRRVVWLDTEEAARQHKALRAEVGALKEDGYISCPICGEREEFEKGSAKHRRSSTREATRLYNLGWREMVARHHELQGVLCPDCIKSLDVYSPHYGPEKERNRIEKGVTA